MKDRSKLSFVTRLVVPKETLEPKPTAKPKPRYKERIGRRDAPNGITVHPAGHLIFIDSRGVEIIKLKITKKDKK
jgi:hypothetical protein